MNISKTDKTKSGDSIHRKISEGILHAEGTGGKAIAFRIKPGFDMIEGIKYICKNYNIKAGTITSILGSLEKVKLLVPHKGLSFPVPKDHKPRSIVMENVSVTSGCGLIGTLENGEIEIDLHMMVFDGGLSDMPAVGGHVACDMPAPAHGTLEGIIEEIEGISLIRKVDKDTGVTVTFPVKE